jgi:hypothetical protein
MAPAHTITTDFFAFDEGFTGGVHIATSLALDGTTTLFLGDGAGGLPTVRILDASTLNESASFNAYDPSFMGGVFVG